MTRYRTFVIAIGVALAVFLAWRLIAASLGIFAHLIGDWRQFAVAALSAMVMGTVGMRLTMGHGRLANAGQYEKIAVWAALLLSVVSAITTSIGLLNLLSSNPGTGALLMVAMALLIGLGIQLSMLMYALRIGDGLLQVSRTPRHDPDFDDDDLPGSVSRNRILVAGAAIALVGLGGAMTLGHSGLDILGALWTSVRDSASNPDQRGVHVLGPVLLLLGIAIALRHGLLRQPMQLLGIGFSIAIYLFLLVFSSGFGYLSYFTAAQSDEVRAIDRDNHIQTETASLANRIHVAAVDDARDALLEARSGPAYQDLRKRIGVMADLFEREEPRMEAEIARAKADRERALQDARDNESRAAAAATGVAAAKAKIENAQHKLTRARQERARQKPNFESILRDGEEKLRKALKGEDGTGIAACGENCRRAQKQIADSQSALQKLNDAVTQAQTDLSRAEADKDEAQRTLERIQEDTESDAEALALPIVLTDRTSFTKPMSEYDIEPTMAQLRTISRTCATAREMLNRIGVASREIPSCDIAGVEIWLTRYAERQAALEKMETACARTEEEKALENDALLHQAAPNPQVIPPYLRGRLAWVDRCMMAANTGSDRMSTLADEQNRLESEYTTAGYDVRRVLGSLLSGNRYARFALLMALIVDLAILVAGFSANALRGRDLASDQRLVSPDQIDERIAKVLEALSPGAPHLMALRFTLLAEPRPYHEIGDSPFSHRIRLDRGDPEMLARMRLVLGAAGPSYARFGESQDNRSWLLHGSLMALLIGRATTDQHTGTFPMPETMAERGLAIKPLFRPRGTVATPTPTAPLPKIDPGLA